MDEAAVPFLSEELDPEAQHTRALRGQGLALLALLQLGDLDAGEKKLQQALALNPDPDDAVSKKLLEQIRDPRFEIRDPKREQ
jgi:hypothetical protein